MAAIEDDMYEPTMKARMEELQQQKAEIEARLSDYPSRLPAGRWHGNPKSGKSSRDFALSIDVGAQPATNGWVSAPSSPANRAAPLAISEAPRTVVQPATRYLSPWSMFASADVLVAGRDARGRIFIRRNLGRCGWPRSSNSRWQCVDCECTPWASPSSARGPGRLSALAMAVVLCRPFSGPRKLSSNCLPI